MQTIHRSNNHKVSRKDLKRTEHKLLLTAQSFMDVVFDTVGGEILQRSWGVLKPGGRMITIAADSEKTTDDRVKQAFFIVEPNNEQLIRIGDLLESGDLHPVVDSLLPLTQASAAFMGEVRERRGRGKLVLAVTVKEGTVDKD